MQYNKIYEFKINYINKNGDKDFYCVYSDNDDIYLLDNLPDTAYFVVVKYKENDYEAFEKAYLIGKPLKPEDLENELKTATDKDYISELKACQFEMSSLHLPFTIFRIENKLICLTGMKYKGELAGVIKDGKIVKEELQSEQSQEKEFNGNYIDHKKEDYGDKAYIDLE